MVDKHVTGFDPYSGTITDDEINTLAYERVFILATALRHGYTIERLLQLIKIDRWFLYKFARIIQFIVNHSDSSIIQDQSLLLEAKRLGFSDKQFGIRPFTNITYNIAGIPCPSFPKQQAPIGSSYPNVQLTFCYGTPYMTSTYLLPIVTNGFNDN
ncbi:unnamed protein product [Rotaria sp. Silwood1]|nr:unnamed protein product [Rotaria sp. Silwood1]CAF1360630.1 unnamed protein product [Rotaria sp. Silwood1]CAF1366727.1 unnamed protein product [Rotaria sp. Silwood1]CAF5056501.1 unnamed protein product [Rotaria sp. Silwood1]